MQKMEEGMQNLGVSVNQNEICNAIDIAYLSLQSAEKEFIPDRTLLALTEFLRVVQRLLEILNEWCRDVQCNYCRYRLISVCCILKLDLGLLLDVVRTDLSSSCDSHRIRTRSRFAFSCVEDSMDSVRSLLYCQCQQDGHQVQLQLPQFVDRLNSLIKSYEAANENNVTSLKTAVRQFVDLCILPSLISSDVDASTSSKKLSGLCLKVIAECNEVVACNSNCQSDLVEMRDRLTDTIEDMEHAVNITVMEEIVCVFSQTVEPLNRLLKLATAKELSSEAVAKTLQAFHTHADVVCQLANIAASCCFDLWKANCIRGSVSRLERLDPEIGAIATVYHSSIAMGIEQPLLLSYIRLLKGEWSREMCTLVSLNDSIFGRTAIASVAEQSIKRSIDYFKKQYHTETCDWGGCKDTVKIVLRKANRLLSVTGTMLKEDYNNTYLFNLTHSFNSKLRQLKHLVKHTTFVDGLSLELELELLWKLTSKLSNYNGVIGKISELPTTFQTFEGSSRSSDLTFVSAGGARSESPSAKLRKSFALYSVSDAHHTLSHQSAFDITSILKDLEGDSKQYSVNGH